MHLPGVTHLHVNRPLGTFCASLYHLALIKLELNFIVRYKKSQFTQTNQHLVLVISDNAKSQLEPILKFLSNNLIPKKLS